jgi:uncharacterized SAM-binding protein YcdF (DUF218 family)
MFFILSKILAFLTQPFFYVCVFLILGFVLKNEQWKKRFKVLTIVFLLFFSNSFIVDEVARAWEIQTVHHNELEQYDYAILLGGMMNGYDDEFQRANFHGGVDRLLQTLELYNKGIVKKILITSGSGNIYQRGHLEATIIGDYLQAIGFNSKDLLIENQSDNTYENAVNSTEMWKDLYGEDYQNKKFLLVTSASHMRRAQACFTAKGLSFDVFSTNRFSGPRKFEFAHLFIPNLGAMGRWNAIAHEVIGYSVYAVLGYL